MQMKCTSCIWNKDCSVSFKPKPGHIMLKYIVKNVTERHSGHLLGSPASEWCRAVLGGLTCPATGKAERGCFIFPAHDARGADSPREAAGVETRALTPLSYSHTIFRTNLQANNVKGMYIHMYIYVCVYACIHVRQSLWRAKGICSYKGDSTSSNFAALWMSRT